jgi:autotransporter-associated beta strand protein
LAADFDASTLALNDGDQVTNWDSLVGGITSVASGTGKSLITYKANAYNGLGAVSLATTSAFFQMSATTTNIRAMFIVAKETNTTGNPHNFLATNASTVSSANDFQRATVGRIWATGGTTEPAVTTGVTRLNLNAVSGTSTAITSNQLFLLDVVTNGVAQAKTIGYAATGRSWYGDIAEILIYTGAQTFSQQDTLAIEAYLNSKWFAWVNPDNVIANVDPIATSGVPFISSNVFSVNQDTTLNLLNCTDVSFGASTISSDKTLKLFSSNSNGYLTALTGSGNLEKTGDGVLVLSGDNSYTGTTTITAGILRLGKSNVIPDGVGNNKVLVKSILDLNSFDETVNGLSGTGTVDTISGGSPTLTIGSNDTGGTFDGVIKNTSGNLGLNKIGSATTTLTGLNTYSGPTTISRGTLSFSSLPVSSLWNLAVANQTTYGLLTLPNNPDLTNKVINVQSTAQDSGYSLNLVTWTGTASGTPTLQLNGTTVMSDTVIDYTKITYDPAGAVSFTRLAHGGGGGGSCHNGASNYPACNNNVCLNKATNFPACNNICLNGATNYPSCNNVCTNGATNYPTCSNSCTNGATNFPTCDNNVCTNGATNFPTCDNNTCTNGATNFPVCTTVCTNGATNYPTCNNICLNGATNYPTCDDNLHECTNGATNYPSCNNVCTNGATNYPTCSNVCTNGSTNYPTCDNHRHKVCTNGATNYPDCNNNTCTNGATNFPACNNVCTNGATNYPTCSNSCTNGATNYPSCDNNVLPPVVSVNTSGEADNNFPTLPFVPAVVNQALTKTVTATKEVINTPVGAVTTKIISTAGVVTTGAVAAASIVFNPASLSELFLLPLRLWGLLMSALGLRKRNRPWGTVYDSITKQPLDPAYVVLQDEQGKELNTSITDLDGRYGFLIGPGTYKLVANKTNYVFPSTRLLGQTQDELYTNLYFGETLNLTETGGVIAKNIPLDPIKFDWNEVAKKNMGVMRFYSKWDLIIKKVTNWCFGVGIVIAILAFWSAPYLYNSIILGLYGLMILLRLFGVKPKYFGWVLDKTTGFPLAYALVHIYSPDLERDYLKKVCDSTGRYYALVPPGKYIIKVDRQQPDGTYVEAFTSEVMEVKGGVVNGVWRV